MPTYCLNSLKKTWSAQRNGDVTGVQTEPQNAAPKAPRKKPQDTVKAKSSVKFPSQAPVPETPLPQQPGGTHSYQSRPKPSQEQVSHAPTISEALQVYDDESLHHSPLKEGSGIPDDECDYEEHAAAKSSPVKAGKRVTSNVSTFTFLKS